MEYRMSAPVDPSGGLASQASATSTTLLQRVKSRDEKAWEHLVRLYAPLVYRVCRVKNVPPDEAADVAQETFRAVVRNIGTFHRDRPGDSFRAWLATIARNKVRDHFRKQAHRPHAVGGSEMQVQMQQLPDFDLDESTDGSRFDSHGSVIHRAVELVRSEFEPRTWDAFWKTAVEGLAVEDVASQLGVSKWAVYQARSRVIRRLREDLRGLLD
jgi:RNA polymerase sigma-70 factor (ECF subfamily)